MKFKLGWTTMTIFQTIDTYLNLATYQCSIANCKCQFLELMESLLPPKDDQNLRFVAVKPGLSKNIVKSKFSGGKCLNFSTKNTGSKPEKTFA